MEPYPPVRAGLCGGVRVGLVAPVWCAVPPVGYGGTEQVVDALARGLVALGHEVVLAATGDSTCPVPRRALLPSPVPLGEPLPELRHVLFAHEQLAGCDVVHDHTLSGPLLAVRRTGGPPVVTTCHGVLEGDLLAYYRRLSPRVPVIAISRSQASAAPGLARAVVHHGVVPEDFPAGPGGGPLLFLGRMSQGKGAHRAIDVARAAGQHLVLAAKVREPEEHAYFAAQIAPRLGPGVAFVGEVAGERKLALLREASALLMPIRWAEPFGMVMVEALACGTPVLAFAEGAAPEVVEHGVTGFLCRDEAEMAAYAGRVGELSRAACRAAVESRFSARRLAADHVEVYRSLLRPGRQQRHPLRQARDLQVPLVVDLDVEARAAQWDPAHRQ